MAPAPPPGDKTEDSLELTRDPGPRSPGVHGVTASCGAETGGNAADATFSGAGADGADGAGCAAEVGAGAVGAGLVAVWVCDLGAG